MRSKYWVWYSFILAAALFGSSQCHAQIRYVLFEDNFDDNRNGWLLGDRGKTLSKIDSGSFYLESKRADNNYSRWIQRGFFHRGQDFEITIRLKQVKGKQLRGYALQWGGDAISNRFHEMWLRQDGMISIDVYDHTLWPHTKDLLPYTPSIAFKKEAFNQILVRKSGNTLTYFLNGTEVFSTPYQGVFGADLGFLCPVGGAIRVDYLQISLLNSSPQTIFSKQTPNVYMVSVGIAKYLNSDIWQGLNDLSFTVNDAKAMADFFSHENVGAMPVTNLSLLLDERATKKQILDKLKEQLNKAWGNDLVIFYFAGHGISDNSSPENPLYLLPYDYQIGEFSTAIHYNEILQLFEAVPVKNKVIVLDACHSGGSLPQLKGSFKNILGSMNDKEIAILTSSDLGETSLELGELKRGLFSYYLMHGLTLAANEADTNNDEFVSILELFIYAGSKTTEAARAKNNRQTPQLGGKFNSRLPLAIIRKN